PVSSTGHFTTPDFQSFSFFGPASPGASDVDPQMFPVQFTPPYFDCGGANKWVVSAVSPVVDFMPRYSNFTHMRRPRFIGLIVMDIDLNKIDFNPCGLSPGNPGPSYLAGIDRCKPTTSCKHVAGFGLKRGSYTCVCKPGTRWPWWHDAPYRGVDIEQATEDEYTQGFTCLKNQLLQVMPVVDQLPSIKLQGGSDITNTLQAHLARVKTWISSTAASQDFNQHKTSNRTPVYEAPTLPNTPLDTHSRISVHDVQAWNEKLNVMLLEQMRRRTSSTAGMEGGGSGYSVYEIMRLVDRLRDFQGKRHINQSTTCPDRDSCIHTVDNYIQKNNVDVDLEREYQRDVSKYRTFKRNLRESGNPGNVTGCLKMLADRVTWLRQRHEQRYWQQVQGQHARRKRASVFDEGSYNRMLRLFRQIQSVTSSNCRHVPNHQLYLPGDVTYGAQQQFEAEGRTALRLSHFLSLYLQQPFASIKGGNSGGAGPRVHDDHLFGEVVANVMGNFRILAAGVFFNRDGFVDRDGRTLEMFGPWAYRRQGSVYALDTAGLASPYLDQDWFLTAKSRFLTNVAGLVTYKMRPYVRANPQGTSSKRHENFPLTYRAAPYELGHWTRPHFRCDGRVDAWVITYVSPFFGLDSVGSKLEFSGVTTVEVPLNLLEINQCPQPFYVANAFKNTARCDYFSTQCAPLSGFPFVRGAYSCKCRLGFEYWHADGKEWFEGSFVELEYEKKKAGIFNR
ncbi:uncharacterized protein LOC131929461, partial [Physella acuta]|uniref:uncharacterized protein LOC131929461 n=1 Tax=Physella acuta TaxID=109671 RepID=UPI0027DBB0B4